jgi:5-methylcytosine-specific restriction endonuclease McrA
MRSSTGFSPETRLNIMLRDDHRCSLCGKLIDLHYELHHRRPRGSGGSKDPKTNLPSNGVLLDPSCHRWVESNRELARERGFLVRQGNDPAMQPIDHAVFGLAYLNTDATWTPFDLSDGAA